MRRFFPVLICLALSGTLLTTLELIQRIRHPHVGFRGMTNSLGFRGPEFSPQKPPGTVRIVFLGSSTTFGVGLDLKETFPFRVGEKLREAFPGRAIESLNAGCPNRTSDWLVQRAQEIFIFKPDTLVVLTGYNDAATVYENMATVGENGKLHLKPWYFRLNGIIGHRSVLYVTLREKFSILLHGTPNRAFQDPWKGGDKEKVPHPRWFHHYPDHFRENLIGLIESARREGVETVFLDPPLSRQRSEKFPLYRDALSRLRKELAWVSQNKEVPLIDLPSLFSAPGAAEGIGADGLHFTAKGNELIAEAVTDFLKTRWSGMNS